ncbi:hypothetical protein V2W45_175492 [Cenococcum geophilum]
MASSSWFELGVKRASGPAPQAERFHICFNVHGSDSWHLQRHIWDVQNPAKRKWLRTLAPGDTLQVFPKARYGGWENRVQPIKIVLYGNETVE